MEGLKSHTDESEFAMDEAKAAEYIARAAELRRIAAEADGPGDRDTLITAAETYERLAQRIVQDGIGAAEPLPVELTRLF
jgi:hypothetical protein